MPVHGTEPSRELDLLLAVETLLREDEHPVPVQRLLDRGQPAVVDRGELHTIHPRPERARERNRHDHADLT